MTIQLHRLSVFLFLAFLAVVWGFPLLGAAGDRITGRSFATRSEVLGQNGMAATSQPLATQVAIDILKRGGSAVDAAIAANAVLGLVEPTGCGIGGDLFAIVWDAKTRKLYGLNASGRSPARLTLDHFRRKGLSKIPPFGPLPVTVPGTVDGWFELHGRFGKLPMDKILEPAINYARSGFPVTELIAFYWELNVRRIGKYRNFRRTFMPGGRAPKKGEVFKNPDLARTYQAIARRGRKAFYRGDMARTIDRYMRRMGGFLSAEDLAAHHSTWVDPVVTRYRGYDVWELPPNGQGIAALQILNVLEGYDLRAMGFGSAEHIHAFVEAKKLAFADRARYYADPDFNKIPVKTLISKAYAAKRRKLIDRNRAARSVPAGKLASGDTIYLTVADRAGNMVSLIQSNYRGMGSGMVPDGLGFVLQDRGELFDLRPGHFNSYAPKKRPFHTIIPAFVTRRGVPFLSFGVMGGATQPQMHVQIIVNVIDFGMNLQEAGDAPRIVHFGSSQPTGEEMTDGGTVYLESGFAPDAVRELVRKGHRIGRRSGGFGGYQAIGYDPVRRVYSGASESRKDGHAAGY
ncbi:MAG: gamma-glutamyltransferase [Proteobacteria bacterium]|nr:gamma-glutamyltransferase [Pseudomonadota bacterium]